MNSQDLRKDNKRRTDTNGGEDRTQRKTREDKKFAPFEAELICPLTQYFFGECFWGKEASAKVAYNQGFEKGGYLSR